MRRYLVAALFAAFAFASVPAAFAQNAPAAATPTCSSGDPVVWVNTSSKAYHLQGDKYFGTTKKGKYLCKSAADSAGYHQSKSSASGKNSMSGSSMKGMSPAPAPSSSPSSKHHHHKSKTPSAGATGSPAPAPSST